MIFFQQDMKRQKRNAINTLIRGFMRMFHQIQLGALRAAALGRLAAHRVILATRNANARIHAAFRAARNYQQHQPPIILPHHGIIPAATVLASAPVLPVVGTAIVPNNYFNFLRPRIVPPPPILPGSFPELSRSPTLTRFNSVVSRLSDLEIAAFKARAVDFIVKTGKLLASGVVMSAAGIGLYELVDAVRSGGNETNWTDLLNAINIVLNGTETVIDQQENRQDNETEEYIKENVNKWGDAQKVYWENRSAYEQSYFKTVNEDYENEREKWRVEKETEHYMNKTLNDVMDKVNNLTDLLKSEINKPYTGFLVSDYPAYHSSASQQSTPSIVFYCLLTTAIGFLRM
jgi:hypothetical protein